MKEGASQAGKENMIVAVFIAMALRLAPGRGELSAKLTERGCACVYTG